MAKYLVIASYTAEGMKGIADKGGTARREAVEKLVADLGGTVESFYFGFGEGDAYVTVDLPDNVSAAAVSMTVGASGMVQTRTIVLLTRDQESHATVRTVARLPMGDRATGLARGGGRELSHRGCSCSPRTYRPRWCWPGCGACP